MKYALLAALVCAVGFVACSDDDDIVGSSATEEDQAVDIGFTAMVISDEEQAMIDEKLAVIKEYYADKEPDHFLILVGNKETLVDDMSCNSHDQAVVEQMLSGGHPQIFAFGPQRRHSRRSPERKVQRRTGQHQRGNSVRQSIQQQRRRALR